MDREDFLTRFKIAMDFTSLDNKLQEFIRKRNELAMLAEEIGMEVKNNLLFVEKK